MNVDLDLSIPIVTKASRGRVITWTPSMHEALFDGVAKHGKAWRTIVMGEFFAEAELKTLGDTQSDRMSTVSIRWAELTDMTKYPTNSPIGTRVVEAERAAKKQDGRNRGNRRPFSANETNAILIGVEHLGPKMGWERLKRVPTLQALVSRSGQALKDKYRTIQNAEKKRRRQEEEDDQVGKDPEDEGNEEAAAGGAR